MAKRLIIIVTTILGLLGSAAAVAGSAYTKIANNGAELDDGVTALGTGPLDWACTRDNATGLVWEVKTADASPGLRDMTKTYTNYDDATQAQKPNGSGGYINPTQTDINAGTNSIGFANAVNETALCNDADWRRPSREEIALLVGSKASNSTYFPNSNVISPYFWTGSPYLNGSGYALVVHSVYANSDVGVRSTLYAVRLVRGGQPLALMGLSVGTAGSGAGRVSASGLFCTREGGASFGTCWSPRGSSESVTLTASPAAGNTFAGWGDACSASGTAATCTLTMDTAKAVTATFAKSTATRSIVIDPATPTTLYAALQGSGVYRSLNSGINWSPAATQPANLNVKALVIKPGSAATLFAASYGGGVFKSTDSGVNWNVACATQPSNLNLLSLSIDASGKLYAGSEAGVFVSSNDCGTWTAMNTGLPN